MAKQTGYRTVVSGRFVKTERVNFGSAPMAQAFFGSKMADLRKSWVSVDTRARKGCPICRSWYCMAIIREISGSGQKAEVYICSITGNSLITGGPKVWFAKMCAPFKKTGKEISGWARAAVGLT